MGSGLFGWFTRMAAISADDLISPSFDSLLSGAESVRVKAAIGASHAPKTWLAYRSTYDAWCAWCALRSAPAWPPDGGLVALWCVELAEAGRAVSTIRRHVAGLRSLARLAGVPATWPLADVLRGLARSQAARERHQAAPIGIPELARMVATLAPAPGQEPEHWQVQARAVLLLGWASALRRSELAALAWSDVDEVPGGLVLRIRRSKTDQLGAGALVGVRRAVRRVDLCPVAALLAWREIVGPIGLVFRGIRRNGEIGDSINDRTICRIVGRVAEAAGLGAGLWSGHSLRAGFATEAADAGLQEHRIRRVTRHKSAAGLAPYVRTRAAMEAAPELL